MSRNAELSPKLLTALRYWIANKEACSVLYVKDVKLHFVNGWGGTDVTPPENPRITIHYRIEKPHQVETIELADEELLEFIGEIAYTASGRNF